MVFPKTPSPAHTAAEVRVRIACGMGSHTKKCISVYIAFILRSFPCQSAQRDE